MSLQICSEALFIQLQKTAKEFPGAPKEGSAVAATIKDFNEDCFVREIRRIKGHIVFLCQGVQKSEHFGITKIDGESVWVSIQLVDVNNFPFGATVFTDQTERS